MTPDLMPLLRALAARGLKLAAVESFTGGLFGATVVAHPGASQVFVGALVAYSPQIKAKLGLDCSQGVISAAAARTLARAGRTYFEADYCISFTGNAGPSAQDNQPVGRVFIAINEQVFALQFNLASRQTIQTQAVTFALRQFRRLLKAEKIL